MKIPNEIRNHQNIWGLSATYLDHIIDSRNEITYSLNMAMQTSTIRVRHDLHKER